MADCLLLMDLLSSSSSDYYVKHNREDIPKIKNVVSILYTSTNQEIRKHFRVSIDTANILIEDYNKFRLKNITSWNRGTEIKSIETEIFIFLWFAANKTTLREVSQRFDTSISTTYKIIENVMDFLIERAPIYIKFPRNLEEKENVAKEFYKVSGFPSTIGCIDGTSIQIVTPRNKIKSTYVNRHDTSAITLQRICDYKKCFIDVFTGIPGKIHDSRVLKLSDIHKTLPEICSNNYHILGDSAYPIREWLLTPYKNFGNLSEKEQHYNKIFSSTRVLIENTFGLLKSRFRQLLQIHMHSVDKISKFIISCCVLHNLCIMNSDEEIYDDLPVDENVAPIDTDSDIQLRRLGEMKRETIKIKLSSKK